MCARAMARYGILKAWKEEGKKQINTAAQSILKEEAVKKVKDLVLDELNTAIENRMNQYMPANKYDELEKKIGTLESTIKPDVEKAAKDAVDELMQKYKKQTKGAEKGKEEEK